MAQQVKTPLCDLLSIRHPVLLAGMARTSGGPLAAAVSNAGGLGTVGGLGYTPSQLDEMLTELKSYLDSPNLPFGVDLALPQVGNGARATNHDYTHGKLDELIEVTIKHGAKLFVSAVGVPPARTIKRLHEAGILGHEHGSARPRHAEEAMQAGCRHHLAVEVVANTGDIHFSFLHARCRGFDAQVSLSLTGQPPLVVAAGGVNDGRSLASALMLGASGVWVGTRFVASVESGASRMHKEAVVNAGFNETIRSLVVSGRPLRLLPNDYIKEWESKPEEIKRLTESGVVPFVKDMQDGKDVDLPFLMGHVSALVKEIKPAREIVESMVAEAAQMLRLGNTYLVSGSKL
ncbi:LOW QUALITY PROTEIN: 2-nitropropane dioxygenase [Coccidioides immitis H538.4]|uniref:2-nitropropane dioxygenase n=1 Tax=Coccidioides immitis H538.4 TaxID=396776 RepID=A0A0J8RX90_COCIT|nr:LOW QUALITY PROTEIN: 2-nitropropane dioxygenase [Coccidioides immitis H538.4]